MVYLLRHRFQPELLRWCQPRFENRELMNVHVNFGCA